MSTVDTIAVIPARSGSKSVPHKNIRVLNGKPLLAYSIEHALAARGVSRVIVSTDSEDYAAIARKYGAETPFLRPHEIAGDFSTDFEVFQHALQWLHENENTQPELLVHLRPTHPVRDPSEIDRMVELLRAHPEADSVRSLSEARQTPYKMWLFSDAGRIAPVCTCEIPEAYNNPRQLLPKAYMQNASIDVVRSRTVLDKHSMTGDVILGYVMALDFDIDTEAEFLRAERHLLVRESLLQGKPLTICCDIDGIIAEKVPGNDYGAATPNHHNIHLINTLHDAGHSVLLFTARGSLTGLDWQERTRKQMQTWGVRYAGLQFGKPAADIYVDDKLMELDDLESFLTQTGAGYEK